VKLPQPSSSLRLVVENLLLQVNRSDISGLGLEALTLYWPPPRPLIRLVSGSAASRAANCSCLVI